MTYLVGQNNLFGRQMMPLSGRQTGLNMFNILVKRNTDLLISWSLSSAVGSFLVGRGPKSDNRSVELQFFLGLNDITLVGRATIC